ncbi:uncharacterized protein LOC125561914 isoform X2 [Nematostella vectensis]|uniref:uncharacterized protein LOC125561914 isoform X2 n=1 Tax=Nematostella vectensis TaxID=45351 RepID=UPI00207790B8|nr:uncharacterized protein LOC125561914 isoform X2 [Nematostella vectensis]
MSQTLSEREVEFLRQHFTEVRTDENYFYGIFDEDDKSFNSVLEEFICLSSSSFVKVDFHAKGDKRYSESASPVFQHVRGNLPIKFFGHPFLVESAETQHCLYGPIKGRRSSLRVLSLG